MEKVNSRKSHLTKDDVIKIIKSSSTNESTGVSTYSQRDINSTLSGFPGKLTRKLPCPSLVDLDQAIKDFRREKVIFNGVPFIPSVMDPFKSEIFPKALSEFSSRMQLLHPSCYNQESFQTGRSISEFILQNSCRTSAGADSYFLLQRDFCVNGTTLLQRTEFCEDLPINIDLSVQFVDNKLHLKSKVMIWNSFSVYDNAVLEKLSGNIDIDPLPWLEIDSLIIDDIDFMTCDRTRHIKLLVYSPTKRKYYTRFDSVHMIKYFQNQIIPEDKDKFMSISNSLNIELSWDKSDLTTNSEISSLEF